MLLLTLIIAALTHNVLTAIHDVIIIGAGTSGISAAKVLNQKHIDHAIIESRDRIGGRIYQTDIDGVAVDLGASFIHNPYYHNSIHALIKEMGWRTIPAQLKRSQEIIMGKNTLSQKQTQQFSDKVKQMQLFIAQFSNNNDCDLATAWLAFYNLKHGVHSDQLLTRLRFELQMEAAVNGADLNQISARQYSNSYEGGANDYIPQGGYLSLLKSVYEKYCRKTKIYFNETVVKIDYTGEVIKITTKKGNNYYCKKVILSVPLGLLKNNKIQFVPSVPNGHKNAIQRIGFGVFNKIIVSFENKFWKDGVRVINFISPSTYYNKYQQCYVIPDDNHHILMFFMSGNHSIDNNRMTDKEIIKDMQVSLNNFVPGAAKIKNYTITRWEEDEHSLGSYSFYTVGTNKQHFRQLQKNINEKLWIVGEHVHPRFSSNVHGAYDSGKWGAQWVADSLSDVYILMSVLLLSLMFIAI